MCVCVCVCVRLCECVCLCVCMSVFRLGLIVCYYYKCIDVSLFEEVCILLLRNKHFCYLCQAHRFSNTKQILTFYKSNFINISLERKQTLFDFITKRSSFTFVFAGSASLFFCLFHANAQTYTDTNTLSLFNLFTHFLLSKDNKC